MTQERIADIKSRLAQASEGPWIAGREDAEGFIYIVREDMSCVAEVLASFNDAAEPDAQLIAHAPTDLQWLLERVEALEQENATAFNAGQRDAARRLLKVQGQLADMNECAFAAFATGELEDWTEDFINGTIHERLASERAPIGERTGAYRAKCANCPHQGDEHDHYDASCGVRGCTCPKFTRAIGEGQL